jgi:hypothetical protein
VAATYAAFLNHAFDQKQGRFRNFMSFDRRWLETIGSEDCQGHALWALGLCVSQAGQGSFQMLAAKLFELALPVAADFSSPRAWAFTLIGIDEYLRRFGGDRRASQIRESLTAKLMQRYADAATDEWHWFEEVVSYANDKLPHAMILNGRCMSNPAMLELGLKPCAGSRKSRLPTRAHSGPSVPTVFIRAVMSARSLINNPSKRKLPFPRASKPIKPRAICFGSPKRAAPLNGFSVAMILGWRFTMPPPAAAATGCTWTA